MELIVRDVAHAYNGVPVVTGIDFTVESGEIVVIIGPSGCGKSTLLSIFGGLLQPTAGEVLLRGQAPADSLNPITYVFQDFALLPWRTVSGNVALALEGHPLPHVEKSRRIADALARTGLADFADAFPKQLSGGMRQRCGIARALVVRPAILLMDEPLSALDAQTRDLLTVDFMDIWSRERTTGVWVTHNLDEAIRLADRVVVLSRRPGMIKAIMPLDIPRAERGSAQAQARLVGVHDALWDLMRDEAKIADREMLDV
jgi:NitT/TauT family transport system ATP-binding protein